MGGVQFDSVGRAPRLSDLVVEAISSRIVSGELAPGTRLPSEAELARSLGVSVPSVREGLAVLQNLDLIAVRHGAGRHVNGLSLAALTDERIGPGFATGELLLQLYEVRMPLELASARAAALRATDEDLVRLEEACVAMEEVTAAGELGVEADAAFHHAIACSSGNQVLEMVDRALQPLYGRAREVGLAHPGRVEMVLSEHRAILDAITEHDPEAAEAAMQRHIGPLAQDAIERLDSARKGGPSAGGSDPSAAFGFVELDGERSEG